MRRNLAIAELGELLGGTTLAILATRRADGSAMLSPVWHEWADDGFSIVIPSGDIKSRQLARDPHCTVLVASHEPPYRSIELSGTARVSQPPDLVVMVRRIAQRYLGEEAGSAYAEVVSADPMELVRLERAGSRLRAWDFADELA